VTRCAQRTSSANTRRGDRIQREIEEYSRLSQQVMQLMTETISEGVEKVRASVDQPTRVPQEKD
jgi:hypothetical protein